MSRSPRSSWDAGEVLEMSLQPQRKAARAPPGSAGGFVPVERCESDPRFLGTGMSLAAPTLSVSNAVGVALSHLPPKKNHSSKNTRDRRDPAKSGTRS